MELCGFQQFNVTENIRSNISRRDSAVRQRFNGAAVFRVNPCRSSDPVGDCAFGDAKCLSEGGLVAAECFNCFDNRFHVISKASLYPNVKRQLLTNFSRRRNNQPMIDNMQLAARITEAMDAAKARDKRMTQDFIAEQIGVTKQAVNGWRRTGKIDKANLAKLAQVIGADLSELLDAVPAAISETAYTDVLAFGQAAGLSDGEEIAEYQETYALKFKTISLRRKNLSIRDCMVIYGKGDSMLPRIHDGDAILIDTSDKKPRNETLYLIRFDGAGADAYSVKQCKKVGHVVMFESLNPQGDHNWREPKLMEDPKSPIEIIGRVRWIGSWEG